MKQINLQTVGDEEISLEEAREMCILHEGQVYKFFDEGCTRFVYVNDDMTKVLKLNKNRIGIDWNSEENDIYENASEDDKKLMAETKLLNRGFIEQKFVTPIKYGGRKLNAEQRAFAASCRNEVGWDGDELVCYDLDEFKKYL